MSDQPDNEIIGYGEWSVDEDQERPGYVALRFTEMGVEGVEVVGVTIPAPCAVDLGASLVRIGEALIDDQ